MDAHATEPSCFSERWRKARKPHRCCACRETIPKGHRYHVVSGIWDGSAATFKHCARCWEMYTVLDANNENGEEGVVLTLDCGMTWQDVFEGDIPEPEHLAFMTADEAQELAGE